MKKLLFITIALLATMSVNAQDSESLIYEKDWTGVKEFPYWFGSDEGTGATMEMVADGIAIHNPRCQNEVWTPQIVITDDCLNLEEGHNYLVRLTLKIPSNDSYGVQVGDFYTFDKDQINVKASDSWQVVDVEFLDYDGAVDGKNHVVLLAGYCVGTTIVKKVEVYELKDALPAGDGVVVYKQDWTGVTEFTNWFGKESTDATLEMVADGIAITNPEEQSQIWTPQTAVTDDCICLEDGHDYVVRLTLKIRGEKAGTLQTQAHWKPGDYNFYQLKCMPSLNITRNTRFTATVLYISNREMELCTPNFYASARLSHFFNRHLNVYADFRNIAGQKTGNRALVVGAQYAL